MEKPATNIAMPMTTYGEIHRGLQVEQLLEKAFADPKQSASLQSGLDQCSAERKDDSEEGRNLSVREAITQFFAHFKWEALSENEQLSVLDRCGKYFPTVNILPGKTQEWKEKQLRAAVTRALPGAVDLLLRQGASVNTVDEAGQTVLHLLFKNLHNRPEKEIIEVLNLLLAQSTLNLSAVDERRDISTHGSCQHCRHPFSNKNFRAA